MLRDATWLPWLRAAVVGVPGPDTARSKSVHSKTTLLDGTVRSSSRSSLGRRRPTRGARRRVDFMATSPFPNGLRSGWCRLPGRADRAPGRGGAGGAAVCPHRPRSDCRSDLSDRCRDDAATPVSVVPRAWAGPPAGWGNRRPRRAGRTPGLAGEGLAWREDLTG